MIKRHTLLNGTFTAVFPLSFTRRTTIMFSFLNRKDPKKSTAEKETEGFVIVGETAVEQTHRVQATNIAQPSTNVIVQSAKLPCVTPACKAQPALPAVVPAQGSPAGHAAVPLSDLLCDIPFTLAPHVLAMQSGFSFIPDVLLSRDINYNLATFHYDFTLENSVLCNM